MKIRINNYLNLLEEAITGKVNNPFSIILFKKAIYLFILLSGLTYLPIADQIWSGHAFVMHHYPFDSLIIKVLNIMSRPGFENFYLIFVLGQLACCLLALVGFQKRLMGVFIYFFSANLYYNVEQLQNGGTNLLLIILFYLMFINESADKTKNEKLRVIDISVTNFALLAARIQICILYFVSATYKLYGSHWLDGSALYYVLNIPEYSTDWIRENIANKNWMTIPITYFTLIFQLAFPITVWMKKLKPITLWIGLLFHILIIFMMGLTDFGIIMILMYLLFIDEQKANLKMKKYPLSVY